MSKIVLSIITLSFLSISLNAQVRVKHNKWDELLTKHVSPYGKVNFKGLQADEKLLDEYLEILSSTPPLHYWSVDEQKAFWINAYNAFTVKLILKYYPLESIQEIKENDKNAWHIPFIKIGEKMYTLDYIENTMLRAQFNDSRIHFAINCTAISCPPLRSKAYSEENLEIELRLATKRFVNDNRFNILSENHLQISQLFSWYKEDFTKEEGSIPVYINTYTPHLTVSKNPSVTFLPYNWGLNEQ